MRPDYRPSLDSLLPLSTGSSSLSLADVRRVLPNRRSVKVALSLILVVGIVSFVALIRSFLYQSRLSVVSTAVNAGPSLTPITSVASYASIRPDARMEAAEEEALQKYASRHLEDQIVDTNFYEFAHRLRLYADLLSLYGERHPDHVSLYREALERRRKAQESVTRLQIQRRKPIPSELVIEAHQPIDPYPASRYLWTMELQMFPWAHRHFHSILELKANYSAGGDAGLVIPVASHHMRFAVHLIKTLRVLGCDLPIRAVYAGEDDLRPKEVALLRGLPGDTEVIDVCTMVDCDSLQLKGWQIKPFAILIAPWPRVILADADVIFLQNPARMLKDPDFIRHGVLIFHDRTLFAGDDDKPRWLDLHLPRPLSRHARQTRMYQKYSAHEQESGVIVWDKSKRLAGLLAACKLNGREERDRETYRIFYGDKETFWIGLEMAGQSWGHLQPVPGVIGEARRHNLTGALLACGRILQFDREGDPLWFNGGVVANKFSEEEAATLQPFTHYAREGTWDFESSCLDHQVTPINDGLARVIQHISALYTPRLNYSEGGGEREESRH